MKLERVFEDLGDFVASYRGAISREGMLHVADSHWQLGTTLKVDLRLEDGLTLVRGLATVVRIQLLPDGQAGWLVALKFLDLDTASRDLLDRLEQRNTGEGVAPFRLADPTIRPPGLGSRPVHRSTPPRPMPMSFDFTPGEPAPETEPLTPPEDEYAPEHEPHPALRSEPSFTTATDPDPAAEEEVPLGFGVSDEPERLPPARPFGGVEATFPTAADEPGPPEPAPADTREDVALDDANGERPSRLRLLLWTAALAAVAVIAVTLTWLLVPELFSGTRVADTAAAAATPEPSADRDADPGSSARVVQPPVEPVDAETQPAASASEPSPSEPEAAAAVPPTAAPTAVPTTPPPPTTAPAAATAPLRILAADWHQDSQGTTVVITASRPLDPSRLRTSRLDGDTGPREILRLLDVSSSALAVQAAVGGRDLKAIRTWLHDELRPAELHIVLDLADAAVAAAPPEVAGPTIAIRLERTGR